MLSPFTRGTIKISTLFILFVASIATDQRLPTTSRTGTGSMHDFFLNVCSLNVNSLNMSSLNKPAHLQKIYGILKLKSDITLLSDIRLSNRNNVNCSGELEKIFKSNPYGNFSFFFNSTMNRRGVGILINNKFDFSVEARRDDPDQNYLLLRLRNNGNVFIIGTIYGPNSRDPAFFMRLRNDIVSLGNFPTILGGDFNATYSCLPVADNPDCLNMQQLPNSFHSELISDLCANLDLYDPLRFFNPELRVFSYQPRAAGAINMSRIDYFLISGSLLQLNCDSKIADSVQSAMFDHKAVLLSIGSKPKSLLRPTLSNKIFSDPDLDLIIDIVIKEVYIFYQDRDPESKRRLLALLGSARQLLRDLGPCNNYYLLGTNDANRAARREEIKLILANNDLMSVSEFPTNIDKDVFFEMILNNLRNDLLSYQSFIFRYCKAGKASLCQELDQLRLDPVLNFHSIQEKELLLRRISEREISAALQNHPVFEFVNAEKMSPLFLKLAKGKNASDSLSVITNNDLSPFQDKREREEFIVKSFEEIYKVPENAFSDFEGCIDAFLGPEICAHPIVINSKLTPHEAAALNNPLSLQELDDSVLKGKIRTAGGPDGFNNFFIKKYWTFFRKELLEYAECCFRKKSLTYSFRSANVKLIPKKGDKRLLKNWRPISLLNCFYKIISRAINERLKKISNIIFSRAQKGFTSSRYIHEVLINVAENIAYCNSTGTSGAIISIDQAKAFDTIYHGFVRESYKFFGVGNEFLDMMDTIGTNRCASIILDGGESSRNFNLGTGRPQGDTVSPQQFNTGDQILLFRIELDPLVASIYIHLQVPRCQIPIDQDLIPREYRYESKGETDKVDGFADDATASTICELQSLSQVKTILDDFAVISGLKCNYDKTNVMQVGPVMDITNEMRALGFNFTDEITLLGFKFNRQGICVNEMFQLVRDKIVGLVNIWERYRLSFPGRLNVCKGLLISQLGYVGSILMPDDDTLLQLQNLINNFVLGNIRLSKDRLYLPVEEGGGGLINLKHFLIGLHSTWVHKAQISTRDVWRVTLRDLSAGNCYSVSDRVIDGDLHPILHGICKSYCYFRDIFYAQNRNFREAFILNNSNIIRGQGQPGIIDLNFFNSCGVQVNLGTLSNVKTKDLLAGNSFISQNDLSDVLGINVNMVLFLRLRHAIMLYVNKCLRSTGDGTVNSLDKFFKVKTSPARRIRLILDKSINKADIAKLTSVKTFVRITGINWEVPRTTLQSLYGSWKLHFLSNKIREFSFRYFNNQLSINTRRSHYVQDQTRQCTLCVVNGVARLQDETFLHLFLQCPITTTIHDHLLEKIFPGMVMNDEAKKRLFFTGSIRYRNLSGGLFSLVCCLTLQYIIWEAKIFKKRISAATAEIDFKFIMLGVLKNSPRFNEEKNLLFEGGDNFWDQILTEFEHG
jgi:exonuclease III